MSTAPPYARTPTDHSLQADECYRCGYLLLGIANNQACPECGLLAERSRRVTDELHETRPRWLRGLFFGVVLILLSILLAIVWMPLIEIVEEALSWRSPMGSFAAERLVEGVFVLCAITFWLGVFLLTRPEKYEPADRADRRFRFWLRFAALAPLLPLAFLIAQTEIEIFRLNLGLSVWPRDYPWLKTLATISGTLGSVPLPLLLFLRLRNLAKRARSAHLAEHCLIVGIGASLSLLYAFGLYELTEHAEKWGLGTYWTTTSTTSLIIALIMSVAACLFVLWSLYLMVRFAGAFFKASRQRRRNWRRDDRSVLA